MIQGTGPASIYVRISEDRDGDGLGVRRQEKDCRALAARLGWEVAKVYEDNDLSASKKGVQRPQYQQLLADIEAGKISRLIVDKSDRLYRRNTELEHLINLIEGVGHPVEIAVVKASDLDLSTTNGRMIARILGATAQAEAETIRDRVKRKMGSLVESGAWKGGPRPFGWGSDGMTERPEEVGLLREAKDRILAGETQRAICIDWKKRGVKAARGGDVQETTLRKMLLSSRPVGRYKRRDGSIWPGQWKAIFDENEWQQLGLILRNKARNTRARRPARVYLLTGGGGLLKCGQCGGPMYGRPAFAGRPHPYYSCQKRVGRHESCGGVHIQVPEADTAVMEQIAQWLTPFLRVADFAEDEDERQKLLQENPNDLWQYRVARQFGNSPNLAAAMLEVSKIQEHQNELAELWGKGSLTMGEWQAAKAPLEKAAKAAGDALEAAQAAAVGLNELAALDSADFVKRWREMDVAERRRVILALVKEVRIQPHRAGMHKGDGSRVEIQYRAELAR